MPLDDVLMDCEMHMDKSLEHLKHELRGIRTGRASPALVENLMVMYYDVPTQLKAIASIQVPEATQLLIKPFSAGDLKAIEKAISDSKLGLSPSSDGKALRLNLPPMSQERRIKMAASVKDHGETAKIALRSARRDANKILETEQKGGVTEDALESGKEQVQELLKTFESKIDHTIEDKKKEIMEV